MARLPEILTVCGVGYGTSLMLRMYIEDILEDLSQGLARV